MSAVQPAVAADASLELRSSGAQLNAHSLDRHAKNQMRAQEELEFAIYRALRGEVPPSVRRIVVTELTEKQIRLDVYVEGPSSQGWMGSFEEDVEAELQMSSPSDLTRNTLLACSYLASEPPERVPGMLMVYDNPWAEWTGDQPVTDLAKR